MVNHSRALVGDNTPLYYSEWNDGLYMNPAYHDTAYASAFIVKNLRDLNGINLSLGYLHNLSSITKCVREFARYV